MLSQDIDNFSILGYSTDSAPGEVLDKVARQLKLHAIRQDLRDASGGRAIEVTGSQGDPHWIDFHQGYFNAPLSSKR